MNQAAPGTFAETPGASPRRLAVVVHRGSGGGDSDLDDALAVLRDAGLDVAVTRCDGIDSFRAAVAEAAATGATVVIGGGDGSLSASLPLILEHGCTLGILPMGTANDLARSLRIPFDLVDAAQVIAADRHRQIDVGLVNGRPFFNVASVGFTTEVARRHSGERKQRLGLLNYPLCWLEALRDFRPPRATLRCDDEVHRGRFMIVSVANGRYHGGGLTIAEDAEIDDGQLTVYYLNPVTVLELCKAFYSLRFGRLSKNERARVMRCATAEIADCRPLSVDVDGELVERTPATFGIRRKAVRVLAPPRDGTAAR